MRHRMRLQVEICQMESEPRRQCFVGGAAWIAGSSVIFAKQKETASGIVPCWQRSCKLGLFTGGRAQRWRASVVGTREGSSCDDHGPGNGLAEGAVKELLRHSTEMGLGRQITHDSLAWQVAHAAATINLFRPGLDGRTPCELRVGRKFRRLVAPWWQKVWWMSAKKHVSRISAESRWQEGIFLGILGGGVDASDYAFGTPDGVQTAQPIKFVPESDAWDIELLLAVEGLSSAGRPCSEVRLPVPEEPPGHVLPPPVRENLRGPERGESTIRRDVGIASTE